MTERQRRAGKRRPGKLPDIEERARLALVAAGVLPPKPRKPAT